MLTSASCEGLTLELIKEKDTEIERLRDAMICACEFMSPEWAAAIVLQRALRGERQKRAERGKEKE